MILLVSGPSGAGKTTFVNALLKADPRLRFSISTTTRPDRGDETDAVGYTHVTKDEFEALLARDAFVEWAEVHGNYYGTPRSQLEEIESQGKIPLLDLDVQGGKNVIGQFGDELVSVFIFPPSWEELERRLRARGTDDEATIQKRLANARWEVGYAKYYRYFVVNDDLQAGLAEMMSILTAEGLRRERWDEPPLSAD